MTIKLKGIPWLELFGGGVLCGLLVAPWGYYLEGTPWPGFWKAFAFFAFLSALYHIPRFYRLHKSRRSSRLAQP